MNEKHRGILSRERTCEIPSVTSMKYVQQISLDFLEFRSLEFRIAMADPIALSTSLRSARSARSLKTISLSDYLIDR